MVDEGILVEMSLKGGRYSRYCFLRLMLMKECC